MSELTRNMQTHCVGRLLIDLPQGTTWSANASSAQIGNLTVAVTTGISQDQYEELIERRWQEVQAIKKDQNGKAYLQPSERITSPEGGTLFTYEFEHVEGLAEDDETVVQKLFHQAEGYFWRDGSLFRISPSLNAKAAISQLFPRLHSREPNEIPTRPGLCLSHTFIDGYYDIANGDQEEVNWGFTLPLDLSLVVREAAVWEPGQSMLERRREADKESAGLVARLLAEPGVVAGRKEYRATERLVGELAGEEYVMGGTEQKEPQVFKTNIGGEWAYAGRATPTPFPSINLGMDTTYQTTRQPASLGAFPEYEETNGRPTQEQFFEVWDAIIDSVRLRPSALLPPAGGSPLPPAPDKPKVVSKAAADDYVLEEFLTSLPSSQNWMDKL